MPHFDAKAEANAYFSGLPATFLVTSFYWDNLYMFGLAPKKGDDGRLQLDVPDGRQPSWPASRPRTSARSPTASSRRAPQYIGKTVGITGESLTHRGDEREAGEGSRHRAGASTTPVDADVYRGFGFPGADEMGNMFQVYRDFEKEVQRGAQHRRRAEAQPGAAELRSVAGEEQEQDQFVVAAVRRMRTSSCQPPAIGSDPCKREAES